MKKFICLLLSLGLNVAAVVAAPMGAGVAERIVAFVNVKTLNEAGLSNYTTLAAATRNPAEFFGTLNQTGTIERAKRADLVLLEANPLNDIANSEKRAGVMLKGRYFTQAELNTWLDEIAPRFQKVGGERK